MIQVNQLSKRHGARILFDDVSFTINKKEKCALVGRNGSGKSTLLRLIHGDESADGGEIITPKGYRIGMLSQHFSMHEQTVIEEAAKGLPKDQTDQRYRAETILFGLGFNKEDMSRSPAHFSGGFQIRIQLCKLLVSAPNCILLDEPSNYLDILSLRWLINFLRNWQGESVVISHDRDFLDQFSTHTLGIHRNSVKKFEGGSEEYYSQLLLEEEIYERTRENLEKKKAHLQSFVDRFGAKATKAAQAQARKKAISKLPALEKLAKLHNLNFRFKYAPYYSQKVLSLSNASYGYPNSETKILKNFNLQVDNREKIAIIGKNGRGKSTLLQVMALNLDLESGNLKFGDHVKMGVFGQTNIDRLNSSNTIYEEISEANAALSFTEVKAICGAMMFPGDLSDKPIHVLSGGERSRVLLGKILAQPCNLLLLDEPTNHLDTESVEVLVDAIESFPGTVIMVTHSEWILRRIPSRLVVCKENKKIIFDGTYDDFLEKNGWEDESVENEKLVKSEKKNEKKLKEEKAQEKAKSLVPMKKKLDSLEKKITDVQISLEENTQKYILAIQAQEKLNIPILSKKLDDNRKELDQLFKDYEALLNEYESLN